VASAIVEARRPVVGSTGPGTHAAKS